MPSTGAMSSMTPDSTASSLIERVQARDANAWQRLVTLYGPLVYGWCRRAGLQPEDARDVGQEVFLAVARTIHEFRHGQAGQTFRGWLWTITANKIRDHFRATGKQPHALGGSDFQQILAHVPAEQSSAASSSYPPDASGSLFCRCLSLIQAQFEDRTWQAFWRVTVEGQTPAEVAAELGMTPAAVRKAKSRVLQRLRQELSGLMG